MTKKDLVGYYYTKITKSLKYLEFTFRRVQSMSTDPTQLAPEQLELWDSFAVRFARTSDLFLSKFIKAIVLKDDPAFDGGFRDFLNRAEKLKVISHPLQWHEIRQLRNVTVHEYSDQDLKEIFGKLISYAPQLLDLPKVLSSMVTEP